LGHYHHKANVSKKLTFYRRILVVILEVIILLVIFLDRELKGNQISFIEEGAFERFYWLSDL
jgi:hypothetical protein